ncbi:hypothetical protein EDD85DRAFT_816459 [Armillaria nabsnona]|nr:hypothetical protein EDD85DRAFT_816459 [Armillaria nabsnona]
MFVICLIVMYLAETRYGITAVYIETTFSCGSVVMNSKVFPLVATLQALTLYQHHHHTCVCLLRLPHYCFDWVIALILLRIWAIHRAVIALTPSFKNHSSSKTICALIESAFMYARFCHRDAYNICALK